MGIDKDTVERVGNLAKIALKESEVSLLSFQLSLILEFMAQLNEVNTDGIQENSFENSEGNTNRLNDIVSDGNYIESILNNAPACREGFFTVTKVIE